MDWVYFTEEELACKGTDECDMHPEFMEKLIAVREDYNQPMIITSGYRHLAYNDTIGGLRTPSFIWKGCRCQGSRRRCLTAHWSGSQAWYEGYRSEAAW